MRSTLEQIIKCYVDSRGSRHSEYLGRALWQVFVGSALGATVAARMHLRGTLVGDDFRESARAPMMFYRAW